MNVNRAYSLARVFTLLAVRQLDEQTIQQGYGYDEEYRDEGYGYNASNVITEKLKTDFTLLNWLPPG